MSFLPQNAPECVRRHGSYLDWLGKLTALPRSLTELGRVEKKIKKDLLEGRNGMWMHSFLLFPTWNPRESVAWTYLRVGSYEVPFRRHYAYYFFFLSCSSVFARMTQMILANWCICINSRVCVVWHRKPVAIYVVCRHVYALQIFAASIVMTMMIKFFQSNCVQVFSTFRS